MRIKKIQRVIQFEQSRWMKPYIDLNIEKRKRAVRRGGKVGKDLMNPAVFGKTMENLQLCICNVQRAKRFREDMFGNHMSKLALMFNRSIQVGFTILDRSKYHMHNIHFNVWMPQFHTSTLLLTDTDLLSYEVGMKEINHEFHFSDYPEEHYLHSFKNMKVVGLFNVRLKEILMTKCMGIRP